MRLTKILAIIKLVFVLIWIFLFQTNPNLPPITSILIFIYAYIPVFFLFLFIITNSLTGLLLFKHKPTQRLKLNYIVSTFSPIIWFIIGFIGFLFTANKLFILFALSVTIVSFLILRKVSLKYAFFFSFVASLMPIFVFIINFQEDYCERQGILADPTNSLPMIPLTKELAQSLDYGDYAPNSSISVNWKAHLLCHQNFDLNKALIDTYLLKK